VGVRPENAYREDRKGDHTLAKASGLPAKRVAAYKATVKRPLGQERTRKGNVPSLRFFQKAYFRAFAKQDNVVTIVRDNTRPSDWPQVNVIALLAEEKTEEKEEAREEQADEAVESFKLHYVQERTKEFNRRLRETPHNEDLWLEYVDFQDISLEDTEFNADKKNGEGEKASRKAKQAKNIVMKQQALTEKKLSILKAALDKNPRYKDSVDHYNLNR